MIKSSSILKWSLIIGIVLVVNLFFAYAIKVIYDAPEYENFCEEKQVQIIPETQDECVAIGGQWTEGNYIQRKLPSASSIEAPIIETDRVGSCYPDYTCSQLYGDANTLYERNVFVALTILGVALIIISVFIAHLGAVSLGLSLGGILSLIIGTMRYWSNMDDYLRLGVLAVALIALIWLGIKKFKD